MARQLISTGSPFETEFAYSRAVVQGEWCFVAGTTGFDYTTMTMPPSAEEQARQALRTIAATLESAGFTLADVVRVHTYLTDTAHMAAVGVALREAFAEVRPASTMVLAGLVDARMLVEIEVTALRRR